jgi:hypothetical protein
VLASGELGLETDTNKLKVGDGTTTWTALAYFVSGGSGGGTAYPWKGSWSSSTAYAVNDCVQYNGSSYVCIQAGTNRQPDTQTLYWDLVAQGTTIDTDSTLAANSDSKVSSQKATKAYVDTHATGINTGDQALSISGSNLTISGPNGNTVSLPASGGTSFNKARFLAPYHGGDTPAVTDATPVVGRVLLELIEVPYACTVDAIVVTMGTVQSGNLCCAIYGPVSLTTDTCAGAALVVQSASVAVGAAQTPQVVPIASTALAAGKYYLALQFDNVTARYSRQANGMQVTGWAQYYDRAGGYGTFTAPCPTVSDTGGNVPGIRLRVAS